MPSRRKSRDGLDSPWKETLERFREPALASFFPHVHDGTNRQRGYVSLDRELQQVVRDARLGRRLADRLFKVRRKAGPDAWLLIHVEVQGRKEPDFPERMFTYSASPANRRVPPRREFAALDRWFAALRPVDAGWAWPLKRHEGQDMLEAEALDLLDS